MSEIVAKYGEMAGAKIQIKESLTWLEFAGVSKLIQGKTSDPVAANNELIKIGVASITTPQGNEQTEKLQIIKVFESLDTRDALRAIKALTALIQDDDDPKES